MYEFRLPALGSDMEDGTLLQWRVVPGQSVHRGEVVAVVDTTKAAIDVECWHDGIVHELLVAPGTKIKVGTVLARLLAVGEQVPALGKAAPTPASKDTAPATGKISPAARRKAEQLGLPWQNLRGTGSDGAITLADVEQAAASASTESEIGVNRVTAMRATIAAAMSRSKREIPHYYLSDTVSFEAARRWLMQHNATQAVTERLLPAALFIKAAALACQRFPEFNGHYQDGRFVEAKGVHVGVAITLRDGGLVAPALRDVAQQPLPTLMQAMADLVQRARAGSLRSSELSDAGLTITNLGEQGVEAVWGVIYPPQVAMLGFGAISVRPWVVNDVVQATEVVQISLAADHRVSNGHRGALFLRQIGDWLQQPERL